MPEMVDNPLDAPLGELLALVSRRHADRPALLSAERSLTWGELDEEVNRLANLLISIGVAPGDPVGMVTIKRPEVVAAFLACARIGAVFCPVNFKLHRDRLVDQFATIGMKTVLAETSLDSSLDHLAHLLHDRRRVIYVDRLGRHGETLYGELARHPATPPDIPISPDSTCYLNFTSGTTGRPKGAITSHKNIVANALSNIEGMGFGSDEVFLGMFSVFSHPHELFHRNLLVGGAFVILDTLNPRVVCEAIERFGVTWMMAVPSFYEMLLTQGGPAGHDLSSLRVLEAGGAWVSAETLGAMEERFDAWFMPMWGSTETTGVALAMPPGRPRLPGATGLPMPGYLCRVVDEGGDDVSTGEVGELLVRGEAVAAGYLNRPEETRAHFRDGWYATQDLVRVDGDGFVHFVSRRSEMMKIGGIRVYPLELEQVLLAHPEVEEAVVVRHEERLRGEVARAVVKTRRGSQLKVNQLRSFCKDRLAVYQVPRIIEFWSAIPRLPNGKVDKPAVLEVPPDGRRDERG